MESRYRSTKKVRLHRSPRMATGRWASRSTARQTTTSRRIDCSLIPAIYRIKFHPEWEWNSNTQQKQRKKLESRKPSSMCEISSIISLLLWFPAPYNPACRRRNLEWKRRRRNGMNISLRCRVWFIWWLKVLIKHHQATFQQRIDVSRKTFFPSPTTHQQFYQDKFQVCTFQSRLFARVHHDPAAHYRASSHWRGKLKHKH